MLFSLSLSIVKYSRARKFCIEPNKLGQYIEQYTIFERFWFDYGVIFYVRQIDLMWNKNLEHFYFLFFSRLWTLGNWIEILICIFMYVWNGMEWMQNLADPVHCMVHVPHFFSHRTRTHINARWIRYTRTQSECAAFVENKKTRFNESLNYYRIKSCLWFHDKNFV